MSTIMPAMHKNKKKHWKMGCEYDCSQIQLVFTKTKIATFLFLLMTLTYKSVFILLNVLFVRQNL